MATKKMKLHASHDCMDYIREATEKREEAIEADSVSLTDMGSSPSHALANGSAP